jgi:hypothetical protein
MNVYQKLNEARSRFHQKPLKKSGHNKFAGYNYFELSDFVIPALEIFKEVGLTSIISFGKEIASMEIVDNDKPEDRITFTSPMSSAALKGCHEVQNLGAVQTYLTRYLFVSVFHIIEHDALDATTGQTAAPKHRPTEGVLIDPKRESLLRDVAISVKDHMDQDDVMGAYEEVSEITDSEEKTFLWGLLDSKSRSAIKKQAELAKGK